jgi:hypothetical protein
MDDTTALYFKGEDREEVRELLAQAIAIIGRVAITEQNDEAQSVAARLEAFRKLL